MREQKVLNISCNICGEKITQAERSKHRLSLDNEGYSVNLNVCEKCRKTKDITFS